MKKINSNGQILGGAADLFKSNILKAYKNRTDKNIFWFDFDGYNVIILKDYDMWQMTIKAPDGDYILTERAFNLLNIANGDYTATRWSNAVVDSAVKLFFDTVGDPDETDYQAMTDDMFDYAAEAKDEIELLSDDAENAYADILNEMETDEPDRYYVQGRVDDLYRILVDIENELSECLHRCDVRTGCDIGWDDFCTADYFDDIKIMGTVAPYSIAEFIDYYDSDAAEFMSEILEIMWRDIDDDKQDTFRNLINDLDLPLTIAA